MVIHLFSDLFRKYKPKSEIIRFTLTEKKSFDTLVFVDKTEFYVL